MIKVGATVQNNHFVINEYYKKIENNRYVIDTCVHGKGYPIKDNIEDYQFSEKECNDLISSLKKANPLLGKIAELGKTEVQ